MRRFAIYIIIVMMLIVPISSFWVYGNSCFEDSKIIIKDIDDIILLDSVDIAKDESIKISVVIKNPDGSEITPPTISCSISNSIASINVIGNKIEIMGNNYGEVELKIKIQCPYNSLIQSFTINVVNPEMQDHYDFGFMNRTEKIQNNSNNYKYVVRRRRFLIEYVNDDPSDYKLFSCERWLSAVNKHAFISNNYQLYFDVVINTEYLPKGSTHVGVIEICSKNADDSYTIVSKLDIKVASFDVVVIDMQIGSQTVSLNGVSSQILQSETPRLISRLGKTRTYIPLRLVANYCSMIVGYNNTQGIASICANDMCITVPLTSQAQIAFPWVSRTQYTIGSEKCIENKEITTPSFTTSYVGPSNVGGTIVNGTGFIELRAILESFGAQVVWADGSRTIRIIFRPGWASSI